MYSYGSYQFIACYLKFILCCLICENATDLLNVLPLAVDTILSFIGRGCWRTFQEELQGTQLSPQLGISYFLQLLTQAEVTWLGAPDNADPHPSLGCFLQAFLSPTAYLIV